MREAARPANQRRSIVYQLHGAAFPYLQTFELNAAAFGFATPAQIAAVYVVARARPGDWHALVGERLRDERLVENVRGYFQAAGAPTTGELFELHKMFDTFQRPNTNDARQFAAVSPATRLQTVAFLAAVAPFDTSGIKLAFRDYDQLAATAGAATLPVCQLVLRSFKQPTPAIVAQRAKK